MKLSSIFSKVHLPASANRLLLKGKKCAPTLMIAGGTVLVIGGTVYACMQTRKAMDILDDCTNKLNSIRAMQAESNAEDYSEKDARKDRMNVYKDLGIGMAKTYGIAALAIGAGLGMIICSHRIMLGREAALTAGYSALLATHKGYRERVQNAIGKDAERIIYGGGKTETVEVTDENGEVVETIKDAPIFDEGDTHSPYSRLFCKENLVDEAKNNWHPDPMTNLKWLRTQQCWANDTLRSRGHLYLNEVYEQLGFPTVPEGQIVGWLWDPKRHKIVGDREASPLDGVDSNGLDGDNIVDFGMYDISHLSKSKKAFLNGTANYVWLDFNVDGVIYDLV